MTTIDGNTIIIKYISQGVLKTETIHYMNDIHSLRGYYSPADTPFVVMSIILGKNLSCFGRIASTINNQNVTNYQHFAPGSYEFKTPIVFLTFHLVKGTN